MKKLLFLFLCFLSTQTKEIKADIGDLIDAIYLSNTPGYTLTNLYRDKAFVSIEIFKQLAYLAETIPNFEERFMKLKNISRISYLFHIYSDKDLQALEKIDKDLEFHSALAAISFATLPLIGLYAGCKIGEYIGNYVDKQDPKEEKSNQYTLEYIENGGILGGCAGIIAAVIFASYITQTTDTLYTPTPA